jgi:hypothetical protein
VSLGSTWNGHPEFFGAWAHAFEGTPWHVVLAIGEFLDPAALEDLPANVEVHSWIPFLDVLRHASVIIIQGTTGAVMESLYRGCPLLVFTTFAAEAEPSSNQVVAMGLGHALRAEQVIAAAVREGVSDLAADEEVRRRIDDIRQEIHNSGGAARAASAIVEHLAASRPDRTPRRNRAYHKMESAYPGPQSRHVHGRGPPAGGRRAAQRLARVRTSDRGVRKGTGAGHREPSHRCHQLDTSGMHLALRIATNVGGRDHAPGTEV